LHTYSYRVVSYGGVPMARSLIGAAAVLGLGKSKERCEYYLSSLSTAALRLVAGVCGVLGV